MISGLRIICVPSLVGSYLDIVERLHGWANYCKEADYEDESQDHPVRKSGFEPHFNCHLIENLAHRIFLSNIINIRCELMPPLFRLRYVGRTYRSEERRVGKECRS